MTRKDKKTRRECMPRRRVVICRDCGHRQNIFSSTPYRNIGFVERCQGCGGMVDRMRKPAKPETVAVQIFS